MSHYNHYVISTVVGGREFFRIMRAPLGHGWTSDAATVWSYGAQWLPDSEACAARHVRYAHHQNAARALPRVADDGPAAIPAVLINALRDIARESAAPQAEDHGIADVNYLGNLAIAALEAVGVKVTA